MCIYFCSCSPAVLLQDIAATPPTNRWSPAYSPTSPPFAPMSPGSTLMSPAYAPSPSFNPMSPPFPPAPPAYGPDMSDYARLSESNESERERRSRDLIAKRCIRDKHVKNHSWGVTYCLRAALPTPRRKGYESPEKLCFFQDCYGIKKPDLVYYPGHGRLEPRCRLELWRALLAHAGVLGRKPPTPALRSAAVLAAFFAKYPGLLRQIGKAIVLAYAAWPSHGGERLYHYDALGKSCFSAEEAARASEYLADLKLDERVRAHIQRTPFIIPQYSRSSGCLVPKYWDMNFLKVQKCC